MVNYLVHADPTRGICRIAHLLIRDPVVLEKDEPVIPDGDLDLFDELGDDLGVVRIHLAEVDRLERREPIGLLGDRRRNPGGDRGFASTVGRGRVEERTRWHVANVIVVEVMYKAMPDVSQLLHLVDWRFIFSRHKIGVRRLPFNMATCIASVGRPTPLLLPARVIGAPCVFCKCHVSNQCRFPSTRSAR